MVSQRLLIIIGISLILIVSISGGIYYKFILRSASANQGKTSQRTTPTPVNPPINCVVSQWINQGECSKPCGSDNNTIKQVRTILKEPQNGGNPCPSDLSREVPCNKCDVNCVLSEWENDGECSKPCGGGIQIQRRKIITHAQDKGTPCPPPDEMVIELPCNEQACPPVQDCVLTEWQDDGKCQLSQTGQYLLTQKRDIVTQPTYRGKPCPPESELTRVVPCPAPIDCVFNDWIKSGECSKPCGGGIQAYFRTIKTEGAYGGKECPPIFGPGSEGAYTKTEPCNTQTCIDCRMSDWTKDGQCMKKLPDGTSIPVTCGGGTQKYVRTILAQPSTGGVPCPTNLEKEEPCNTQDCNDIIKKEPCNTQDCIGDIIRKEIINSYAPSLLDQNAWSSPIGQFIFGPSIPRTITVDPNFKPF